MTLVDPETKRLTVTHIVLHADYHMKREGRGMAEMALRLVNRQIADMGGEFHLTVDSEFIFSEPKDPPDA